MNWEPSLAILRHHNNCRRGCTITVEERHLKDKVIVTFEHFYPADYSTGTLTFTHDRIPVHIDEELYLESIAENIKRPAQPLPLFGALHTAKFYRQMHTFWGEDER